MNLPVNFKAIFFIIEFSFFIKCLLIACGSSYETFKDVNMFLIYCTDDHSDSIHNIQQYYANKIGTCKLFLTTLNDYQRQLGLIEDK